MQQSRTEKKKRSDKRTNSEPSSSSNNNLETTEQHAGIGRSELSSSRRPGRCETLELYQGDLPDKVFNHLQNWNLFGIDTETSGLNYREDELKLVQIATPNREVYMVQNPIAGPSNLQKFFSLSGCKSYRRFIFHHMLFDLRFLQAGLVHVPQGQMLCTKILMKMVYPQMRSSLAPALRETLGIHISKKEQISDWGNKLTNEQKWYAANDAIDLIDLYDKLIKELSPPQKYLYHSACSAVAIKAELQVTGYTDLLDYDQEDFDIKNQNKTWWIQKVNNYS